MFIDKVRVDLVGGKGGDGAINFEMAGKPSGGNGGNGGDLYLEGNSNTVDLSYFTQHDEFSAGTAWHGDDNNKTGKNGKDVVIKVPLITRVYDIDNKQIAEISKHGEQVLIAKGGRGGLGNYYFKAGQVATLRKRTLGKPGEKQQLFLELFLKADVVFIGLPNAGKSSTLNSLTNSSVKVAPYPFTTLNPNLGKAGKLTLLDLPGLIEGTTKGKGLGTRFMKHAGLAKLVAHFISLESADIVQDYKLIRKELSEINPELVDKTELIILTKKDMVEQKYADKQVAKLKKINPNIFVISNYDWDSIQDLNKTLQDYIFTIK